jgi:hypothetical protein
MEDKQIYSLTDYLQILDYDHALLFRGISDVEKHRLIPSVAREWSAGIDELVKLEQKMLNDLKSRAVILLDNPPDENNNWEWLIMGQRYGMPTRLLDWTTNPLVALYFACIGDLSDGAVYLSFGINKLDPSEDPNPFNIKDIYYIVPRHISSRIIAQSSVFTVSPNPLIHLQVTHKYKDPDSEAFYENASFRILIPGQIKKYMLMELRKMGIGPAVLFPGLDGLCNQIAMECGLEKVIQKNLHYSMKGLNLEPGKEE